MKKYLRLLILTFCFCHPADAQIKRNAYWLMGYGAHWQDDIFGLSYIDFTKSPYELKKIDTNKSWELRSASAVASDEEGNMLFFTNGCYVFNKELDIMENGTGINIGDIYDSHCSDETGYFGIQSILTLPHPLDTNKYYIFSQPLNLNPDDLSNLIYVKDFVYSLVDLSFNNGLGKVIKKNEVIVNDTITGGFMTAVKSEDEGWWILINKHHSDKFYTVSVHGDSISYFEQQIGEPLPIDADTGGQSKFTNDGKMYIRYSSHGGIDLYDFDRTTGLLNNNQHISTSYGGLLGGAAISSNDRFLYTCTSDSIFQYDLEAENIVSTETLVAEYDGFKDGISSVGFYNMELGPDCRIYINSFSTVNRYGVIMHPDELGLACDVQQHHVVLPTKHSRSIPHFPNYNLDLYPVCDSTIQMPDFSTGLFDIELDIGMYLYPNPILAGESIQLSMNSKQAKKLTVRMVTMTGQVLSSQAVSLSSGVTELNLTAPTQAGMYWVYVEDKVGHRLVRKVVVQ